MRVVIFSALLMSWFAVLALSCALSIFSRFSASVPVMSTPISSVSATTAFALSSACSAVGRGEVMSVSE